MPAFLLFATIANFAFLGKAIKRLAKSPDSAMSRALVGQAIGELCWVFPCFVQCFISLVNGTDGEWAQDYIPEQGGHSAGCDVMGFYSMFSLVAGMGTTVIMSWLSSTGTAPEASPSSKTITRLLLAMIPVALFYALAPLMGIGSYKYIHPICYYDWYHPAHSILIFLWTVPMLGLGSVLMGRAAIKRPVLWLHLSTFVAGWGLWPPAALIGLSGAAMPQHFMIIGGVLGHGQALVNPLLYGIIWNSAYPDEALYAGTGTAEGMSSTKIADEDAPNQIQIQEATGEGAIAGG